jgi:hypothetical protein
VEHCLRSGYKNQDDNGGLTTFEGVAQSSEEPLMEMTHHVIDDSFLNGLEHVDEHEHEQKADGDGLVSQLSREMFTMYLISDAKLGLARQIRSLIKAGLVEVDEDRNAILTRGWETKVPPCILNTMQDQGWGKDVDRKNKFCLNDEIRNKLSIEWKFTSKGWVRRSQPDQIVYSHEGYLDRKDEFCDRFTGIENELEGIAQFGI